MIDAAEQFLRESGLSIVRVRYHRGDLVRIEVPVDRLATLTDMGLGRIVQRFKEIGFRFVTVDIEGFRSGNLNQLVQIDLPRQNDLLE